MSARDPEIARLVGLWIHKADKDLGLAGFALAEADPCPYDLICYHAQQCAEKYLKACLVARQVEFPYTHDIGHLLRLVEKAVGIDSFCRNANALTLYESRTRYPYDAPDPDRGEAEHCLALAQEVKDAVLSLLQKDGIYPTA